jgi:hypothetical protein
MLSITPHKRMKEVDAVTLGLAGGRFINRGREYGQDDVMVSGKGDTFNKKNAGR